MRVMTPTILFMAIAVAACGDGRAPATTAAPTAPTATPAAPPPSTDRVTGTVLLRDAAGLHPLAHAQLYAYVVLSDGSGYSAGRIAVDEQGQYTVNGTIGSVLYLIESGGTQPCAASVAVRDGATRDAVVVNDTALLGANLPADVIAGSQTISGMVYETVDGVKRPVPNVGISFDWGGIDLDVATTTTDANGRYVLCGLDLSASNTVYIDALASDFKPAFLGRVQPGRTDADIEMTRIR